MVTIEEAEENPEEHLGRDLILTPTSDLVIDSSSDLAQIRYDDNLKQAIINRLKTAFGEIEFHPLYGSRLGELIGTSPNDLTLATANMHVRESLLQEARIERIITLTSKFREGSNNQIIEVNIDVQPIEQLEPLNLVYALFI